MTSKKQNLYLVETTEAVSYIVDQQFLHIMLVEQISPEDIVHLQYGDEIDWHIGDDKRIYERLQLNKKGKSFYNTMQIEQRAPRYVQAINEMNNNQNERNLAGEKERLKDYLNVNEIFAISKYDDQDLKPAKTARAPKL